MKQNKKIGLISIGGSSIPYGNIFNDSKKFGNSNLEYLSSYLDNKFIINELVYFSFLTSNETILNVIFKYDIVIVFVDFLNRNKVQNIFINLRKKNNDVVLIGFGTFVDNNYEELIKSDCFDYLCLGNPMLNVLKIINNLRIDKYNISDKSIVTKSDFLNKKIDTFYDSLIIPKCNYYLVYNINQKYKTYVLSTRNNVCFGNCTFCLSKKGKYIYRDPDIIINEIQKLVKIGIRDFLINDNDFFEIWNEENKNRILYIFKSLFRLKEKITVSCFAKSHTINLINDNDLLFLKRAGLFCIFVGVDAGNNEDKKVYNKKSSISEDELALEKLERLNIFSRIGFIFLNPYSSIPSLRDNYYFLIKIRSSNIYHYGKLRLLLFKGTAIFKRMLNDNLILNDGKGVYDYKYKNSEINEIVNFLDYFFKKLESKDNYYPFITLKRKFEEAKFLNSKIDEQLSEEIKKIERQEFEQIKSFFRIVFVENNIEKAKSLMDDFLIGVYDRSTISKKISVQLDKIIWEIKYGGISN